MENQILDNDVATSSQGLLTAEAIGFLDQIRKWTKFLSILGFIGLGFLVILGFSIGAIMQMVNPMAGQMGFPTAILGGVYIVMALIHFFPVLYLFNFSSALGRALRSNSSYELTVAFKNLKSHYKFIGVFCIVVLSIYALIFVFGMLAVLMK
ncbi:MAG: hypothetical protein ACK40G_03250 [Cytophagaceae bacterium]